MKRGSNEAMQAAACQKHLLRHTPYSMVKHITVRIFYELRSICLFLKMRAMSKISARIIC